MESGFWHDRWQAGQIGFHEAGGNSLLTAHIGALELTQNERVFVPLCGKTHDIGWLLDQGFRVVGAELSEIAVRDLFRGTGISPETSAVGDLKLYRSDQLEVFVGDVFALDADILGHVDAVYDRAALVALPDDMRARYTMHIPKISRLAQQLLITFDYDQSSMAGPPFSVPPAMVRNYFDDVYSVTEITRRSVEGGLKGQAEADEILWHLLPRG